MADADQVKLLRGRRKAGITRRLGTLERLIEEEDTDGVRAKLDQLKVAFDELEVAQDDYTDLLSDDQEIKKSEDWFAEAKKQYISGIKEAKQWLKSSSASDDDVKPKTDKDSVQDLRSIVRSEVKDQTDMPKIEIDKFEGDPLSYQSFIALFDELVHDKDIKDQIKLTRLLQYTGGSAKTAIRNCALVGGSAGYKQARETLQNRYGNKHLISQSIINDLKYGESVTKALEVQQLADEVSTAITALEKLHMLTEIDTQQCILEIVQRCPKLIRERWRKRALADKNDKGDYPSFSDFAAFLKKSASDMCDPVYGADNSKAKRVESRSTRGASCHSVTGDSSQQASVPLTPSSSTIDFPKPVTSQGYSNPSCVVCHQPHKLFHCQSFKAMRPKARLDVVNQHRLCYNCLIPKHYARDCRKQSVCSVAGCGRKHTKFIHIDVADDRGTSSAGNGTANTTVRNASANASGSSVYLPIVPVLINGTYTTYALLDSGSTNTFIKNSLASKLCLTGGIVNYRMSTLSQSHDVESKVVSIDLAAADGSSPVHIDNVFVIPNIPARYPSHGVDIVKYPHLVDIPVCKIESDTQAEILIGMDNAHILMPLEVRANQKSKNEPYATRTIFGWTLNGPIEGHSNEIHSHFVDLDQQVQNLWQLEDNDSDNTSMSIDDQRVLHLWNDEISFEDGHYTLPIPWRSGEPNLPNNQYCAQQRLHSLVKRLRRLSMFEKYDDNVTKMVSDGYAEQVPDEEISINDGSVWFLPHHAVVSDAKPDKVRIVFDCAAQQSGVSLNSQCYQGPDLNNKLIDVLLRFRQYRYAIMADVQSMYLQVRIPPRDRNALRFLWFVDSQVVQFRMTSHLFGGVWCASSSTFALRRTTEDTECSELVKDTIMKSFYVDDLLKSIKTIDEASEVMHGTKRVLGHGGFNLTKFVINDKPLLQQVDVVDRAKEVKEILPEMYSKALGVRWEVCDDAFHYISKSVPTEDTVTRRVMLSLTAALYDPLGLIAPIVLQGKVLFQEATRLRLSWDVPVPDYLSQKWSSWLISLNDLKNVKFDRCIIPEGFEDGVAELHHFCDASQTGYGACSYVRVINQSGQIHVVLVASKGRLAPIKDTTIPRLELSAAVVAVKLDKLMKTVLEVPMMQSSFWTDSQIVLAYIKNESRRFKVFVANRVSVIRQNSSPEQWFHVSGSANPADILSRGCNVGYMPDMWFYGSPFLSAYKCDWPSRGSSVSSIVSDEDPEIKRQVTASSVCTSDVSLDARGSKRHPVDALADHYSSFYKLKKAMCYLLRVKNYLRRRQMRKGLVTITEMDVAERVVIQYVQSQAYPDEIKLLCQNRYVAQSSSLRKLAPVMEDGLMVIGGRLKHASIKHQSKFPLILPHDHSISRMIALECHNDAHLGTEWTLSRMRTRYWIVKARNLLKNVKRSCITCRRLYAAPLHQKMADLPPERCQPGGSPFSYVGLDIFGPFYIKSGRSEVKRYGCVFSCFTTRAIHIEKLDTLETDSFINGLVRFISRRGNPTKIWSDNGTNLVGACAELSRSFRQLDRGLVIQAARRRHIDWVFNPPHASHHGGVWERMIRTIRKVLVAILNPNARLSDDILHTVFCEAENMVNTRPITKCSDDVTDANPLTPNHLLLLKDNASLPWGISHTSDIYRKRWRHAQFLATQFWKQWLREYLPELQRRQKWLKIKPNLKVGDLVLILDENSPRGSWPLGIVVEVKTGRDGLVRSARLRTKATHLVRPLTKLVMLESSY